MFEGDRMALVLLDIDPRGVATATLNRPEVGNAYNEELLAELPLQIRQWTCPACQMVHDRDHNAAKVILAAGRAERLNDCGARVRPQPVAAVGAKTGSTPTAA